MHIWREVLIGVMLFILPSFWAFAQEQKEEKKEPAKEQTAEEAKESAKDRTVGTMTPDELKKALGLSVYLQGSYLYNTRNPSSGENENRLFDHKANSFTLDLAQLRLQKDADVGGLGYKLKLSAGETAKFIHANGLGNPNESFDLTEAYLTYVAPLGKGLAFSFGKFLTYMGAEVLEAIDNPNYSRSFLYDFGTPFTHTGLKVYYPFTDTFNVSLHVVNGWDNATDNNNGKSVGASIGWAPIEQVAMNLNVMVGPEQDHNSTNNRYLYDWVGTIKPIKNLTFLLNADYAKEERIPGIGSAKWYGAAVIVKYDFLPWFSVALRGEVFRDPDGARTGFPQSLKEVTLTPQFIIAKGLYVRPEYRHDWSDRNSFDKDASGTPRAKTQDTVALGVMYLW